MRSAIGCGRPSRPARPPSRRISTRAHAGVPPVPGRSARQAEDLPEVLRPVTTAGSDVEVPRLIKDVYLVHVGRGATQLQTFDPSTHRRAAEWPASMQDWRDTSGRGRGAGRCRRRFFIRRIGSPIWDSVPAIVVPSPLLPAGQRTCDARASVPRVVYTILELDENYVSHEMLPALAEQHFTRSSGAEFSWRWSAALGPSDLSLERSLQSGPRSARRRDRGPVRHPHAGLRSRGVGDPSLRGVRVY